MKLLSDLSLLLLSYVDANGKELVTSDDTSNGVELGSGGAELIIKKRTDDGVSTKTLGSREFLRYYRQKLRPTRTNDIALSAALASRFVWNVLYWWFSRTPIYLSSF